MNDTCARCDFTDYRNQLLAIDYQGRTTYVISHRNPDSDTVGSAVAYASLLNVLGIRAEAVISSPLNGETAFAISLFGLRAPDIMDDAAGRQFILVDHSSLSQAIQGMNQARIVGIIDHHEPGDLAKSNVPGLKIASVGATASLVFRAYRECDVPISRDTARILLTGILSDTRNMTRNVTPLDLDAYAALKETAGIPDPDTFYLKMTEAIASYGDLSDIEIFRSDYKAYAAENAAGGISFGIGDVNAFGESAVRAMADRMRHVMADLFDQSGQDMFFTIINNKKN